MLCSLSSASAAGKHRAKATNESNETTASGVVIGIVGVQLCVSLCLRLDRLLLSVSQLVVELCWWQAEGHPYSPATILRLCG